MNQMKTVVYNIFEACKLNREKYLNFPFAIATYTVSEIVDVIDLEKFEDAIAKFLMLKDGADISKEGLLRTIRRTLVECEKLCDSLIPERVNRFSENFKDLNLLEFTVIKNFYGATVRQSNTPVKFGPFVVYEVPRHAGEILKQSRWRQSAGFEGERHEKTVIEYVTKARDELKALELANIAFNTFDLLIAFLIAEEYNEFTVGILRMHFSPYQNAIICSSGGIHSNEEERRGFSGGLEISDLSKFLPAGKEGQLEKLVKIATNPANDLERKISRAVEWTGESYSDNNRSSAYLKAVIALEALLKVDEKSIITPSIMSSIAEQCAYLNGISMEDCLMIEKRVKTLYGERSKIAHTGATSVSLKALREARSFVSATIWNFIHFIDRFNLKNAEDFQGVLREMKYQQGGAAHKSKA